MMSAEKQIGFQELYVALRPIYEYLSLKKKHQLLLSDHTEDDNEENEKVLRLAIIGRTNVGKSTMFNQLLGKERTVVSEIPGTTRDTIQIKTIFEGRGILLADTAGLRKDKY